MNGGPVSFKLKMIKLNIRNLIFLTTISVGILAGCSDTPKGAYDPKALNAMDSLGLVIGNLTSCSFSLSTNISYRDSGGIKGKHKQTEVYMRGPDKMYIYTADQTSRKGYFYNGTTLALFNFDDLSYEVIKAPSNIMTTIDSVHKTFGIDFPASDFFFPTLTSDMIKDFDTIFVSGSSTIDSVACNEIQAVSPKMNVFISIDQETHLPKRLEIYYLGEKKGENYATTFSNWKTDPVLADQLFSFAPPPNAVKAPLFMNKTNN
jgi:hypothetical protein